MDDVGASINRYTSTLMLVGIYATVSHASKCIPFEIRICLAVNFCFIKAYNVRIGLS